MAQRRSNRARNPEPTAHVDLEYPSSVPTFTVNPTQLSTSSSSSNSAPTPWFSAFGRTSDGDPLPPECDPKYSDPAYYASANYGKGHRNTSHTAKKPEGHIKRPPNCFLLFRSHVKETGIRIPDELRPILKERLRERKREVRAKRGEDGDVDDDDDDDDDEQDDDEQSVSKISGILWDFLPAAEKSIFRARAAHAKAQHKKFYPTYKYSPQVKDKSVKKRVGKKMAAEKRERLEEAASLLAANLGWVQPESEGSTSRSKEKRQRTATESSTPTTSTPPATIHNYPGSSSFPVTSYSHQPPSSTYFPGQPSMVVRDDGSGTMNPHIRGAHAVNGVHDSSHLPMGPPPHSLVGPASAIEPGAWGSTGLGMGIGAALRNATATGSRDVAAPNDQVPGGVRMYRRTSSCPPPGAHLTWDNLQASSSSSTPAHPWSTQPQQHLPHIAPVNIPSSQPALLGEHTFVRPGGKTARKMRSGNSIKANVLGGQQNSAAEMKSSKRRRSPPRSNTSSSSTPAFSANSMAIPSVPNVRPTSSRDNVAMPMTALSYDSQPESGMWAAQGNYEFPPSATSSPTTFGSSAPPSVLLETPPFGQQLPQLQQLPSFTYPQQSYTFPNMTEQYYTNDPYSGINENYAPVGGKPVGDGQLGLTVIDDHYQFPPPQLNSGYESSDQERTPRSNTLPVDPLASPRRKPTNNWSRPERPSPLSSSHPPTQSSAQTSSVSSPHSNSPRSTPTVVAPTIISPSPVTPIPISMQQQQAEYHHQQMPQQGLDQLGVDINLSVPPGGVGNLDPDSLAGLLEFSFPNSYAGQPSPSGVSPGGYQADRSAPTGMIQEGYSLGQAHPINGGADHGAQSQHNGEQHYYHDAGYQQYDQQNHLYPPASDASLGPLDIPLHELYSFPSESATSHPSQFDPSSYVAEDLGVAPHADVAAPNMSSAEALEYDMMEWRRNSGSNTNNVAKEEDDGDDAASAASTVGPSRAYSGSRRASVQLGNAFGGEMAMALYGFDALAGEPTAQAQHLPGAYNMNMNVGMEFEFQQGPPPTADYSPAYTAVGSSPSPFTSHPNMHYSVPPPLGTVVEERERSPSSEEGA